MSRTYKDLPKTKGHRRERHISVRAVPKQQPDLRKLARALIQLAMAQAESEAQNTEPARAVTSSSTTEQANDD